MISKTAIKSQKIRDSARGEDCALRVSPQCQDGETVVACHVNTIYRGTAEKSPDLFIIYGCCWCHRELDLGRVECKDQLRAMIETQMKLYQKGLIQVK